jgi:hypothetical protein
MPLDPDFLDDCPYAPEGVFIDELLDCDRDAQRVVCRMPTHGDLPITRTQRNHPVKHPPHVSGGLMVHVTGIVGLVHAYYVLDLRHADGWIGYGARARNIRFKELARLGEPLIIECTSSGIKRTASKLVGIYRFVMRQADAVVYESEQTSFFVKVT